MPFWIVIEAEDYKDRYGVHKQRTRLFDLDKAEDIFVVIEDDKPRIVICLRDQEYGLHPGSIGYEQAKSYPVLRQFNLDEFDKQK
jgi:hypothetical protein